MLPARFNGPFKNAFSIAILHQIFVSSDSLIFYIAET